MLSRLIQCSALAVLLLAVTFTGTACKRRTDTSRALEGQLGYKPRLPRDGYLKYGVNPDCSEARVSFDDLERYATQSTNQQEFLDKIPKKSLQTYTFVFDSQSAQAAGISKQYPGVIRMAIDGKLIMRYTCDPSSDVYNTVETIRFDDRTKKFLFKEFDFRSVKSETDCAECHSTGDRQDLRPNWANYNNWPGVFGSNDDYFPPTAAAEQQDFDAFLRDRKNDPCYQTLPWPKAPAGGSIAAEYARYPYGDRETNTDYSLRPNLKFTEVLSHLLAQRNFRRLKQHPKYEEVKLLLAVEAGACKLPNLEQRLRKALPNLRWPTRTYFQSDPANLARGLFSTSLELGFSPGDWTLHFSDHTRSDYTTGISPGQGAFVDLAVHDLVQTQILKDVTTSFPELASVRTSFEASRGESLVFGPRFACIDDLGGRPEFKSPTSLEQLCAALVGLVEAGR